MTLVVDYSSTQRTLDIGDCIRHFEIREVFPVGGFGVTYRAWDSKLNRQVAIKEFFPSELARRQFANGDMQVLPISGSDSEFQYRLYQYLEEARVLATFNCPNIIKVYDFFEASGTAYIVMEYASGSSLKELLTERGVLSQRQCLEIFVPILQGLDVVHKGGYLHRDIKPANIYLRESGDPVLIDFGAAREHKIDPKQELQKTMTAMVSLGYAPPEQYSRDSKWLGPWSDLYSVGASLYHCVNGNAPEEATERQTHFNEDGFDPLRSAVEVGNDSYSKEFLVLIDELLQLRAKRRPQSVEDVLSKITRLSPPPKNASNLSLVDLLQSARDESADVVIEDISGDATQVNTVQAGATRFHAGNNYTQISNETRFQKPLFEVLQNAVGLQKLLASAQKMLKTDNTTKRWFADHRSKIVMVIAALLLVFASWSFFSGGDSQALQPLPVVKLSPQIREVAQDNDSQEDDRYVDSASSGYQLVEPVSDLDSKVWVEPEAEYFSDPIEEPKESHCSAVDPTAGNSPAWQAGKVYNSGDLVSHQNLLWAARWWTQSEVPGEVDVWMLRSKVELPWSKRKIYTGGSEVNYGSRRYRAQWWSQGDLPAQTEVWVDIGEASCSS